jgi:hypothetical protein
VVVASLDFNRLKNQSVLWFLRWRSRRRTVGGNRNKVFLTRGVLGETRVELHNLLHGVEGSDVDWEWGLSDEEGDGLGAWWGGQGTGVLEEPVLRDVFGQLREVERSGLSDGSGGLDLLDVLDGLGQEFSGFTLADVEGDGKDNKGSRSISSLMDHMHLNWEVLLSDSVLRWCMEMELLEAEVLSSKLCCSVDDNLHRRSQVLELSSLYAWEIDDWGLLCVWDRGIDVDWRLDLSTGALSVVWGEIGPVKRTQKSSISKLCDLDFSSGLNLPLHERGAVQARCGCQRRDGKGNEYKCVGVHVESIEDEKKNLKV